MIRLAALAMFGHLHHLTNVQVGLCSRQLGIELANLMTRVVHSVFCGIHV